MESYNISIFDVAAYFIYLANNEDKNELTPLKLQKLVYYSQAFVIAFCKRRLFNEPIQAWRHGPVCPELYRTYRMYGYHHITAVQTLGNADSIINNNIVKAIIDAIWETFGKFSGPQLEEMTHQEDPWRDAIRQGVNTLISDVSIQRYFDPIVKKNEENL